MGFNSGFKGLISFLNLMMETAISTRTYLKLHRNTPTYPITHQYFRATDVRTSDLTSAMKITKYTAVQPPLEGITHPRKAFLFVL